MNTHLLPEATRPAVPLYLTNRPWLALSFSKKTWQRLAQAKLTPPAVALPGHPRWRLDDLHAWVKTLPTRTSQPDATENGVPGDHCHSPQAEAASRS